MTNVEKVIREVALKNRTALLEDDPLMALVTVMTMIGEDYQGSMVDLFENHRGVYEDVAHRWRADATKRANHILNTALEAGSVAMAKGMTEGTAEVAKLIRAEVAAIIAMQRAEFASVTNRFRRYSMWMLAANGAVMVLALFIAACL